MIQVVSRFRVKNKMEDAVRDAFLHRPHLVDNVPGFLGMEVFTEIDDATAFYLVTRWTDTGHYRAWHSSDAHRLSHQGIPRGLKVDSEYTEITILQRVSEASNPLALTTDAADASPFLAQCLAKSHASAFLTASSDGIIQTCNDGLIGLLNRPSSEIVGRALWTFLPDDDAAALRQRTTDGRRDFDVHFLLNFVNSSHYPITLTCRVDVQPGYFVLFGEAPRQTSRPLHEELLQLNNQLAVLSREKSQKNKQLEKGKAELTKAMDDLQTSHWHLRKIQEVLPICMECGKVKSGTQWQDVIAYLKANALFLSHGYCPDCAAKLMVKWTSPTGGQS